MHEEENLEIIQKEWHGSLKSYITGFVISISLTILSYSLVFIDVFKKGGVLIFSLAFLALSQATAQLIYFMHLDREEKPRWELLVLSFMVLVLLIIVIGSLWIMYDLNQRVMTMDM